jgi:hypothetical protein
MAIKMCLLTVRVNCGEIDGLYVRIRDGQNRIVDEDFVTRTAPYVAYLPQDDYTVEAPEAVTDENGRTYKYMDREVTAISDCYIVVLNYAPKFVLERSAGSLQALPLPN